MRVLRWDRVVTGMVSGMFGRRGRRLIIFFGQTLFVFWWPILILHLTETALHSLHIVVQLGRTVHVIIMRVNIVSVHQFTLGRLLVSVES